MKLAACIVNYRSGDFTLACARSVLSEWRGLGSRDELDLVVVDNTEPGDDEPGGGAGVWTAELAALGVRVLRPGRNLGYAGGIQLGFSASPPSGHYLILNPDVHFPPGSLGELLDAAERAPANAGAFAPLTFLDPGCTLALPPVADLTPLGHWARTLGEVSPGLARRSANARTRAALTWWAGEAPFEAPNLSGACLLVPASARAALGGQLLDERFPLYFEDNDLCRRLRAVGRTLYAVPRARVVHHWARSSGIGTERSAEPQRRYAISREVWFERWYPGLPGRFARAADTLLDGWSSSDAVPVGLHRFRDLGDLDELGTPGQPDGRGLRIELPRSCRWLFELALTPHFALAGGALGEGAQVELPATCTEWLFPGRIYARALERDTLEVLGAWTFTKSTPARTRALGGASPTQAKEMAA